jgi:hypothetical protein
MLYTRLALTMMLMVMSHEKVQRHRVTDRGSVNIAVDTKNTIFLCLNRKMSKSIERENSSNNFARQNNFI